MVIEAVQWFKNGDHPEDRVGETITPVPGDGPAYQRLEGRVVRFYRHPEHQAEDHCPHCDHIMHHHGWIDTKQDGHVVCPGDWIINDPSMDGYYPCKPSVFAAVYERVPTEAVS